MLHFQSIIIFTLNVVVSSASSSYSNRVVTDTVPFVQEKAFLQNLDHFNPKNNRLWYQRYFANEEFYDKNKTKNVFLYIAGEGSVDSRSIEKGAIYETAKRYGGIIFVLEHRFYGWSQPFDNLSTPNLQYLSSLQALHDLANFIVEMNNLYNFGKDVKWITVGGSYAGSLSAWMRLKFPHLVYGAVASSAPLYAKLEYPEYLQVVSNDIALNGEECVKNINTAFVQLENVFQNKTNANVTSIFNLCSDLQIPLISEMDKLNLFEYIIDYGFAFTAQSHRTNTTMKKVCDVMNNMSIGAEVERLGEMMRLVKGEECFEAHWDYFIEDLKNETISEQSNMRQWWYQTCTEFGWYQITDYSNAAFGNRIPLEYFLALCKDVYGQDLNQNFIEDQIKQTNIRYGSTDLDVSKLILVQGSLDPWHPVGLYADDYTKRYSVFFIKGTTHCADLSTASEDDPPQLKIVREEVLQEIGEWLMTSYCAPCKRISKVLLVIGVYFSLRMLL